MEKGWSNCLKRYEKKDHQSRGKREAKKKMLTVKPPGVDFIPFTAVNAAITRISGKKSHFNISIEIETKVDAQETNGSDDRLRS